MKVLILGVGGFIGRHLTRALLERTDWHIRGLDRHTSALDDVAGHPRLEVTEGDVFDRQGWIEDQLRWADVCLPLAATALPSAYVNAPLHTFDLDFTHNLEVIRRCAATGTRVVFPSTSEVYGQCPDDEFDEYSSPLVYGPVDKSRWIYAASKQLLDRVIHALADQEGLRFTIFRPFNWTGPGLDDPHRTQPGSSRLIPQLLGHLLRREPLTLVDGGTQRRCFTHIDDGIEALVRILQRPDAADGQIFNLGHPGNERSVRDVADSLLDLLGSIPGYEDVPAATRILHRPGHSYYGPGYQDVDHRTPAVHQARRLLGWQPRTGFDDLLRDTVLPYLTPAPVPS